MGGQGGREQAHASGHGVEAPADGAWLGHRSDVAPRAGTHPIARCGFLGPCCQATVFWSCRQQGILQGHAAFQPAASRHIALAIIHARAATAAAQQQALASSLTAEREDTFLWNLVGTALRRDHTSMSATSHIWRDQIPDASAMLLPGNLSQTEATSGADLKIAVHGALVHSGQAGAYELIVQRRARYQHHKSHHLQQDAMILTSCKA